MKLHWTITVPLDRNKGTARSPKVYDLTSARRMTRKHQIDTRKQALRKEQCMGVWSLFIIDILKNGMLLSHLKRIEASRLQQSMHSEHFMSSE